MQTIFKANEMEKSVFNQCIKQSSPEKERMENTKQLFHSNIVYKRIEPIPVPSKHEISQLAIQIGINSKSEEDIEKYGWFLQYCLALSLPDGWSKETDPKNRIVYHNKTEKKTTTKHPLSHEFRKAFSDLVNVEEIKNSIKKKYRSHHDTNEKTINSLMNDSSTKPNPKIMFETKKEIGALKYHQKNGNVFI